MLYKGLKISKSIYDGGLYSTVIFKKGESVGKCLFGETVEDVKNEVEKELLKAKEEGYTCTDGFKEVTDRVIHQYKKLEDYADGEIF